MSEHIGFRCPDDVVAVINERIEATGKSRSEVIVDMLRAAGGVPEPTGIDPVVEHRLTEMEARLTQVESQLGESAA